MQPTLLQQTLSLLSIIQAITGIITLAILIVTIRIAHGSKATDAVIECNRRFDELPDR